MRLYCTTNTGYNDLQPNSDRSLGGFKSSTQVANDDFSNLFDEVSVMTIRRGRDEYRALVLKNEFPDKAENITIRIIRPEHSICTFRMAVGAMDRKDKYGRRYMENVISQNSKPFQAQFIEMNNDAVLHVGDLEAEEEIGLWIARHVDKEAAKEQYGEVCIPDPKDPQGRRYIKVTHPSEEQIDMLIEWT